MSAPREIPCATLDCTGIGTHRRVVHTPIMRASAFYYVCDDCATADEIHAWINADTPTTDDDTPAGDGQ